MQNMDPGPQNLVRDKISDFPAIVRLSVGLIDSLQSLNLK